MAFSNKPRGSLNLPTEVSPSVFLFLTYPLTNENDNQTNKQGGLQ